MSVTKWQNRFTALFLLLLASFSLLHLFVGCFHLLVPEIGYLYLALLCVFLWISACLPHGILIGMPLSAVLLYYIYRTCSTDLSLELFDVLDRISETYYYHFYLTNSVQAFSNSVASHLVIILFLMFVVAALIASSLTAVTWRIPLCLLSTVPLFAFCIAVEGSPSPVSSLALILFWLLLFLTGDGFLKEGKSGRILLYTILPCLFLLVLLFLLCNPDRYQVSEPDTGVSLYLSRIENKVVEWITNRSSMFSVSTTDTFSEDGSDITEINTEPLRTGWGIIGQPLDMTKPYDSSVADEPVFQIRSDSGRMLYLRGNSYGDYNGTSWLIAEEHAPSSLSFAASVLSQSSNAASRYFEIDSEHAYSCLFLPYYSLTASVSDSFVASGGSAAYRGTFFDPVDSVSFSDVEASVREEEASYREYAHSYYTKLPESTRSAVQTICEENGLYPGNAGIIDQVASFVRNIGTYELSTVPYPDTDYAVYFLLNAKEGYCIHFATAAAVIYRTLGIPARLTEGFAVVAEDSSFTQVTGANAHAWVEIYLDGFGWIPIEVTASSEAGPDAQTNAVSSAFSDSVQDPDPDMPSGDPDHSDEDELISSESMAAPDLSSKSDESNDDQTLADSPYSASRKPLSPFFIVLIILLALFLFFVLQYHIRFFLWKAFYRRSNNRKKAVLLWSRAERIGRLGIPIPEEVQNCAERARFSLHEISDPEIRAAESHYAEQYFAALRSASFPHRIMMKYIYGTGGPSP